jgi:hypothetical protein
MKAAQNQKPKTFSEQEKINAVKKHYADIIAGRAACVGSEKVSKKTYCHRGAGMSDEAPPLVHKVRSPYADKVWTVVNNSVRKSKWSTYYDANEAPAELLHEDEGAWADRA